jgi:hypothetical protein
MDTFHPFFYSKQHPELSALEAYRSDIVPNYYPTPKFENNKKVSPWFRLQSSVYFTFRRTSEYLSEVNLLSEKIFIVELNPKF